MNPSSSHSWQGWPTREEFETARLAAGWDDEEGEADFDFDGISFREAGDMLAELLVSLKLSGSINAT